MFFVSVMIFSVGVLVSIAAVLYVSYVGLIWFLKRPFSYQAVAQWVGFVACMALCTGFLSYFIPAHWQDLMSAALAHFGCTLAFHLLILRIEAFLREVHDYPLSKGMVYGIVIGMYVVVSVNCAVLLSLNGSWDAFAHMAQMAIEYFTRTALLLTLLLDLYRRRLQYKVTDALYNYSADEYEDYDNQW